MNQRPTRSKSTAKIRANRLQLEQLESRTVLATSSLMREMVMDVPARSVAAMDSARAPAFVAFMKADSAGDGHSYAMATVMFRPEALEKLPELDTMKFESAAATETFASMSFGGEKFEVMNSVMRWQNVTLAGITIRFDPAPIIRSPGRVIETPDYPTPGHSSDPVTSLPGYRPAMFDSELSSLGDDDTTYDQGPVSTTWSESYAQATTLLDPSAVDQIWSTVANITASSEDELPSEQLEHEALDEFAGDDQLVSLDDIENLEVELRKAKVAAAEGKSAIADEEDSVTSLSPSSNTHQDLPESARAASAMIMPMYDEGGLADVAAVASDTRLVQSPVAAVLRRVTPDIVSTGNVRDALGLLPKEWSADAAEEATEGEDAPTLSTAYLGSFAVVVAAGLGVVIERNRRLNTPEDELQRQRQAQD